jgi:SlyX protein
MDMEDRLTELEIKLSFQENLVRTLDQSVIELRAEVDKLSRSLRAYEDQMQAGMPENPANEPPPHY